MSNNLVFYFFLFIIIMIKIIKITIMMIIINDCTDHLCHKKTVHLGWIILRIRRFRFVVTKSRMHSPIRYLLSGISLGRGEKNLLPSTCSLSNTNGFSLSSSSQYIENASLTLCWKILQVVWMKIAVNMGHLLRESFYECRCF